MSITQTLADKDISAKDKLTSVAKTVKALRKAYGNEDATIKDVKVNTTHGMLPFSNLEDDAKVETLLNEALKIKTKAIAAVEDNSAIVLDKKVEELISTNALFANATADTGFSVL